ncbi:MAG: lipid-A-disaccharide synthase [Thermodesulfobacteriota bacterium]|nr:lipid-A-disaccharide synthase [Thermodesulfobacteriota bacterium]
MSGHSKRILIVAGEASADLHGSNLIRAIRELDQSIHFYGIGGERIRDIGVEVLFDSSDMAVVGVMEVFSRLKTIVKAFRTLKKSLHTQKPDLVILIDYPDFNLHLAKFARKRHIPVLYYISPQVWAWRRRRVKKIAKLVNKMLVILPFEVPFYEKERVDIEFVGHPLIDIVKPKYSKEKSIEKFNLDKDKVTIGLLPGSRKSEVKHLLPKMLKATEILDKRFDNLQFILPVASTISKAEIEKIIRNICNQSRINIITDNIYDAINVSSMVVVASGTATLEAAIMHSPMVILYKLSPVTYLIGKLLIHVKDIGLVNLVAGRRIVSELVQYDVTPDKIANEVANILGNEELCSKMQSELASVKEKLGAPGASIRAARIVTEMIGSQAITEYA